MDKMIVDHKKHLEQLKLMVPLFWIFTIVISFFQDPIKPKWIVISLFVGVLLFVFEYLWYRYILYHFKSRRWGVLESIHTFIFMMMIIPLTQKFDITYMLISVATFISLKAIFKRFYLELLDRLVERVL